MFIIVFNLLIFVIISPFDFAKRLKNENKTKVKLFGIFITCAPLNSHMSKHNESHHTRLNTMVELHSLKR